MLTVADVVEISGKKKSIVYRDISNGRLTKKGKYVLEDEKFHKYMGRERNERHEKPDQHTTRKKYTPPPPNQKTSLELKWEEKIEHVSEYDFQRDHDLEGIESRYNRVIGRVLEGIELMEPEKNLHNKDLQREVREWLKVIGSHINKNRDIEAKKQDKKSGSSMMAFKQIRDQTFKDAHAEKS